MHAPANVSEVSLNGVQRQRQTAIRILMRRFLGTMRNRPPGLGFACEFAEPSPRAGNEGYRGDRVHAEGQATSIYSAPECGRQSSFWFPVMGEGDERDGRGLGCSRQDPRQLPCRLLRLVIAKPFGKTARATYKVVETSKVCIRSPDMELADNICFQAFVWHPSADSDTERSVL